MATPKNHRDCRDHLLNTSRTGPYACDVTVSTVAPLVVGPYTAEPFICPHGVKHWIEPTGEQIAAWARDGVE